MPKITPEQSKQSGENPENLYLGSNKAELSHLLGNVFIFALMNFTMEIKFEVDELKEKFLSGLERAKNLHNYGNLTTEIIDEIIEKTKNTDWNDEMELKKLQDYINQVSQ